MREIEYTRVYLKKVIYNYFEAEDLKAANKSERYEKIKISFQANEDYE